jgi:carbamoyl-phosphate synthase small subunit
MLATLALESGLTFTGRLFGAPREAGGEVVFHTGMTGYQEILTDPSYAGQIVVFTAAHIGNYGIHRGDDESPRIHPAAVVIRDYCRRTFHRQADRSLDDILRAGGTPGITDVDTRALTIHLRDHGTVRGFVGTGDPASLLARARALPDISETDWVARVTTDRPYTLEPAPGTVEGDPFDVAILDLGTKRSILTRLTHEGCRARVFPADTPASTLLAAPTEGIFLSNGPGDPRTLTHLQDKVREILRHDLPVFGICLGHQLLGHALGATTVKLPFGHHGANHPVRRESDRRVEITSQNHNYAVPRESLPDHVRVTHVSLNDHTVEGMEVRGRDVYSVQYHPEAAPGPRDSHYLFRRFREDMARRRASRPGPTMGRDRTHEAPILREET